MARAFAGLPQWAMAAAGAALSMAAGLGVAGSAARADWTVLQSSGPAPIRSIVRRADGRLIGPRSSGHTIEIWVSDANGAAWTRHGLVASNSGIDFGDPTLMAVPGTRTIFCADREHSDGAFAVRVYRSDDSGDTWTPDSTVAGPFTRFVGAPFLFRRQNGDLQCYYDSEQLAADNGQPGHQWVAMQGRNGLIGPWDHYGLVTASREPNPSVLSRDGMPTVVQIGGDRLMLVTEGVETQGHGGANVVRAIQSWDGGASWDFSGRAIIYQCRVDPGTNRQYNAYAPYAIRVGGGPVWVAFCTDEDYSGPPDFSNQGVTTRHSHIKRIATTDTFEHWSAPTVVWSRSFTNYAPGLFERSPNRVISTLDLFAGNQAVLTNIPPYGLGDVLRALAGVGGLAGMTGGDISNLRHEPAGLSGNTLALADAVHLVRQVAGLDPNP